jgi:hypothetical protein
MAELSEKRREQLGYNPHRTPDCFAPTTDGYIIAQDNACQYEYILAQPGDLVPVAHINRSFQGLSEIVALSRQTGERYSFIFDISNEVYQTWLAHRLGAGYDRAYDGPPRQIDRRARR